MEYYSALKKEILSLATTLMDLADIILSKRSQSLKDKHYVRFHLYEIPRVIKIIEAESRTVFAKAWGMGKWGVVH